MAAWGEFDWKEADRKVQAQIESVEQTDAGKFKARLCGYNPKAPVPTWDEETGQRTDKAPWRAPERPPLAPELQPLKVGRYRKRFLRETP